MVSLSKILYPNSGSLLLDEDLNVASFQGLDGATGSLVIMAWNRKANIGSQEMHQYLNFLQVVQAMDVPAVSLHYCSRELLSTATFKPCNIMLLLFCQREWEGRWRRRWWWRWWLEEVIKIKECGLKTGDVKLENPCAPLLVVLFNIWCHIFQALAEGQKAGTSDDEHMRSKSCSLDSILSSFSSNTTPAYPSNTLPKGPRPIMICT
ncbi:PREDICTED: 5'-adenylylsulfate reductase [Prunus dulcis]|uniref:PREDICTED: 5'-adenylylsulfate reductase n=1 Tax=Prunus dulcis TaxID=3755 RepID=A0A5E4ER81_PRUDU|nr:uncharacterized protein LOC117623618 [Prunus dulcis]KAI5340306.1 hypothetical protein L3X38_019580 [Prunus dulcis]VVA17600.1 PREDICTED: 5'-adenylylsulfate reductase [Prunus dulcis]